MEGGGIVTGRVSLSWGAEAERISPSASHETQTPVARRNRSTAREEADAGTYSGPTALVSKQGLNVVP